MFVFYDRGGITETKYKSRNYPFFAYKGIQSVFSLLCFIFFLREKIQMVSLVYTKCKQKERSIPIFVFYLINKREKNVESIGQTILFLSITILFYKFVKEGKTNL